MEKLRLFERYVSRACLTMFRSKHSNYIKHNKNEILLNTANISRIDSHILNLCRNHFAKAAGNTSNSLVHTPFYPQPLYFNKTLKTGYTTPELFPYLDSEGYLSGDNNVPIIYHIDGCPLPNAIT